MSWKLTNVLAKDTLDTGKINVPSVCGTQRNLNVWGHHGVSFFSNSLMTMSRMDWAPLDWAPGSP